MENGGRLGCYHSLATLDASDVYSYALATATLPAFLADLESRTAPGAGAKATMERLLDVGAYKA